jgi:hypothetical protein
MSALTTQAVEKLMKQCLSPSADAAYTTVVEGVILNYAFNREQIAIYSVDIYELLAELPDEFRSDKGSGWSFLKACVDRHGKQWGAHRDVEALFCLGIAAGFAKWLLPRDIWPSLPGGMPYVAIFPNIKGGEPCPA